MIVKNEEKTLARVLDCAVQFADEIIIVDTGSSDNTKVIASKYTTQVFDFVWQDDFSKARNFSFSKATSAYIMWLDADDVVPKDTIKKLNHLKTRLINYDVVMLPYQIAFDDNNNCTFSYYRERIVKNNSTFYFNDPIHESITPSGNIAYFNAPIEHRKLNNTQPKRNLKIYKNLIKKGITFTPRQQFYYANELYYNGKFKQAIREYNKFLKRDGFVENQIQACINKAHCYLSLDNTTQAINSLTDSFVYDLPRSEALCLLGDIYTKLRAYHKAIYWYKLAIKKPNLKTGAFVEQDKYNFVPYINMSVCYYYLGDKKRAVLYNNKALKHKPYDKTALYNKTFYDNIT